MANRPRVRFKKSPLIEVVYQLQFPTILSITSKDPAEFQELVRDKFPIYECLIEQENELVLSAEGMPHTMKRTANKNYQFMSSDRKWKINLTNSFISLSTKGYTRWEDMRDKFNEIAQSFSKIYKPAHFTRIGLRYIDAIVKRNLGLEDKKWNELLNPHIIGHLMTQPEESIKSFDMNIEYELGCKGCWGRIHSGIGTVNNRKPAFILDCDYYTINTTAIENYETVAEGLHNEASEFIKAVATDVLWNAMEPEDL